MNTKDVIGAAKVLSVSALWRGVELAEYLGNKIDPELNSMFSMQYNLRKVERVFDREGLDIGALINELDRLAPEAS